MKQEKKEQKSKEFVTHRLSVLDRSGLIEGMRSPQRIRLWDAVETFEDRYLDGSLVAIFHGPRKLADYSAEGQATNLEIEAVA